MTNTEVIQALFQELATWNVRADNAITNYDRRKAELRSQAHGDVAAMHVLSRDDVELAELGGRATFATATATRIGVTLAAHLLVGLGQTLRGREIQHRLKGLVENVVTFPDQRQEPCDGS